VKVTVQTTPWPDFQTKAFTEFNAHGDAYDMVVGDSQWLGAGSTQGHYVDLTDFFKAHKLNDVELAPATIKYYAIPRRQRQVLGDPARGRPPSGWAYRKDWFEDPKERTPSRRSTATTWPCRRPIAQLRDIAEFFYRPDQKRYGVAIIHRQFL